MITGSATGVPRPAHLLQLPEGCMDCGDRRLDRSELAQQKIFKITLNLRARRRDEASLGFLFLVSVDGRFWRSGCRASRRPGTSRLTSIAFPRRPSAAIRSMRRSPSNRRNRLKERIRSLKIVHVPSRHHTIQNIMPATLAKEVLHLLPSTTALPAANHRARQGRPTARHQLGEE